MSKLMFSGEQAYMLLGRCRSDCMYFLTGGGRQEKFLWGKDITSHIAKMKELWNLVLEKPEWLSWQDILWFEQTMKDSTDVSLTKTA